VILTGKPPVSEGPICRYEAEFAVIITLFGRNMITGTSYSPGKAFISFAREFFEALAKNDFQDALRRLDSSSKRWSKRELLLQINSLTDGAGICSALGFKNSAAPDLEQITSGYVLRHRLPIHNNWSNSKAVFEFIRKPGTEYFKVNLLGFEA
jgi:hypothetical protein